MFGTMVMVITQRIMIHKILYEQPNFEYENLTVYSIFFDEQILVSILQGANPSTNKMI